MYLAMIQQHGCNHVSRIRKKLINWKNKNRNKKINKM